MCVFFLKQKTAYEMRISDWSSDVCSSDLLSASVPSRSKAISAFMPLAPRWRLGNRACRARLLGDRLLASEQPPPVFGNARPYRRRKERQARQPLGGGRPERHAYDRFPPDERIQLRRKLPKPEFLARGRASRGGR